MFVYGILLVGIGWLVFRGKPWALYAVLAFYLMAALGVTISLTDVSTSRRFPVSPISAAVTYISTALAIVAVKQTGRKHSAKQEPLGKKDR
jgi:thiol:disulfide interchange protein